LLDPKAGIEKIGNGRTTAKKRTEKSKLMAAIILIKSLLSKRITINRIYPHSL